MRGELVVHEPRTVHRLHHRADGLAVHRDPTREPVQTVTIRDGREAVDQLPLIGDQAHVNSFTTQIQTNMQHEHSSPARGQAGSIQPTAYLDTGWSVLCFGWPAARGATRARLPYAVRYGGPTSSRRLRRSGGARLHRIPKRQRALAGAEQAPDEPGCPSPERLSYKPLRKLVHQLVSGTTHAHGARFGPLNGRAIASRLRSRRVLPPSLGQ